MTTQTLEDAMAEIGRAVDGGGKRINLLKGPITPENLRNATRIHMYKGIGERVQFVDMLGGQSVAAEVAYWRNLALLANATALVLAHS